MKEREYIFCSVVFKEKGKSYYYLTEDESLEIGDYVIVDGYSKLQLVKIVDIEKFKHCDVPFDLDKMKTIIKLVKKYNAPISTEKSLYQEIPTKDNENEDISEEGLFSCLDKVPTQVQPVLTEQQVSNYEQLNNIKLPIQYRKMLLKEGNGLRIHYKETYETDFENSTEYREIYGINWNRKHRNDRLSRPFPFGNTNYIEIEHLPFPQYSDCQLYYDDGVIEVCKICDHRYDCIHSFATLYRSTPFYNGTIELVDAGCTYSYHLILNGPKRGEVWVSDENDKFGCYAKSFKEFLELMCTEEFI